MVQNNLQHAQIHHQTGSESDHDSLDAASEYTPCSKKNQAPKLWQ